MKTASIREPFFLVAIAAPSAGPTGRDTNISDATNLGARAGCVRYDRKTRREAPGAVTRLGGKEGEGVLVAAFQSEREEETRDRAERGSAVRGFDQASVAAKQDPLPTDPR